LIEVTDRSVDSIEVADVSISDDDEETSEDEFARERLEEDDDADGSRGAVESRGGVADTEDMAGETCEVEEARSEGKEVTAQLDACGASNALPVK
jgi:hypothetical protein